MDGSATSMIISKSPLRISFLGGGSDFRAHFAKHGGAVLSAAIDKYVYVTVSPSHDGRIHLHYSQIEVVDHASELKHGIVREALLQAQVESGVEIHTIADVPSHGTGLGSSSALAVGLVNALWYRQLGEPIPSKQMTELACSLEIDRLHKPIGEQDQRISIMGRIRLIDWGVGGHDPFIHSYSGRYPLEYLTAHILLFNTGIQRDSNSILTQQTAQVERNAATLNALAQMARYGYEDLQQGDFNAFGHRLDEGWRMKRELASNITNSLIDMHYDVARRAGAWGGKICGAGGGGYLLFIAPPEKHEAIRSALGLPELKVKLGVEGSIVREV